MQEVNIKTASDALAIRLAVAKFMGLEVVGEALAVKYEGNWIIIERKRHGNESMQPIYVQHCHCEPGDDSLEMEGYAPRLLRHWLSCLAVVPDYANDDAAAMKVMEKMPNPMLWNYGKGWICRCSEDVHISVLFEATAPTFAEAVCCAAIAYAKTLDNL